MDARTAMTQTNEIVSGLIAGLTPAHREMPTPCTKWNVHELVEHMCQGGHMIAGGLQGEAPPEQMPDFLAEGPVKGWADTVAHMERAATPAALEATHTMPFGEVPGAMALGVITSDHLTHAWDLAKATGQNFEVSDELADYALGTWKNLVPAEGRTGEAFAPAVSVPDDASALDRLIGYTGRQP